MKNNTFFRKILIPMGILVVIEILMLFGTVFGGGVTNDLNQYAEDILHEKVINRKNYLENEMVGKWANIGYTADVINQKTADRMEQGQISVEELSQNTEESSLLILDVYEDLVSLIRNNRVTGAFVVFHQGNLDVEKEEGWKNKPGLYLRDLDPDASPSYRNQDLLIERAPVQVVRNLEISTDTGWRPRFEEAGTYPFFYVPYQAAVEYEGQDIPALELGYWSSPYTLMEDDKEVIAYSVPLVLDDGSVYGVLGVELTCDYVNKLLPYQELNEKKQGAYVLGIVQEGEDRIENLLVHGPAYLGAGSSRDEFYSVREPLDLYETNTPYSSQQWVLMGAVKKQALFTLANRITVLLLTAILATLIVGVAGSLVISRKISRPVAALACDMAAANPFAVVRLGRTGIREVDLMADSVELLSRNVINSATKFSQILNMASVKIAGFEIRWKERALFLTDNFFDVFGRADIVTPDMTLEEFLRRLADMRRYEQSYDADDIYYKIMDGEGERYIRLRKVDDGICCIGLAEDVTRAVLERKDMEYERDHDLLTGLLNRRAFYRKMQQLFSEKKDSLNYAAVVMMDLDNLKSLNDTYGHDTGDKYIKEAAGCFAGAVPGETVVSRISGDEFYLFFYGYESRETLEYVLSVLKEKVNQAKILLPDQSLCAIRASGGVAWYPDDSTSFEELLRYSDFAMYKVKQSVKGELGNFDMGVYHKEAHLLQSKAELNQLIEQEQVMYHFQPIVDAKTGEVFAYEALMRVDMTMLSNPQEILALAKQESKLKQIEWLTWKKSLESYVKHLQDGTMDSECRIFINSIASQTLSQEQYRRIEEEYGAYLDKVVLEITEEEEMDEHILQIKTEKMAQWNGVLALDDYGSGYNSEKNLLRLSPRFIKVDLVIIRDIDQNADKQKIMGNIVSYAHERGMFVVAEGLETQEEVKQVIAMGADYLQGYFLGKPGQIPGGTSQAAKQLISRIQEERAGRGNRWNREII